MLKREPIPEILKRQSFRPGQIENSNVLKRQKKKAAVV